MQADFEFHINGVPHRAAGALSSMRLLDYLRDNMLTAAKDACGSGGCGACSVLLVDPDAGGEPVLRAVNACQLSLPMVAGRELWTAEVPAGSEPPHPVAAALAKCAGDACGYCLPGVCASLCEAYEGRRDLAVGDVLNQLTGNLCRCTGYRPFRDAAITALRAKAGSGGDRTALGERLPASFPGVSPLAYRDRTGIAFYRPETLLDALRLRQTHPGARIVAGGTSRGWSQGFQDEAEEVGHVISLEAVGELAQIDRGEDRWSLGAAATITNFGERLGEEFPIVRQLIARFGSAQIRNRATIGGNLASAAHHSDLVPVLLALDARVRMEGFDGGREIGLEDFFVGFRQTAIGEGEIIGSVIIPRPEPVGSGRGIAHRISAFFKVSKRRYLDRAIANAAFVVELDGDGMVTRARIALGGVAAYGARAYEAESLLQGTRWEPKSAQAVAAVLKEIFPASSDQRATAAYRNALVAGLWQKFYAEYRDPAKPSYADASLRRFLARPAVG